MNTCKYCGKPLTLTPEYDTCMECQGRIMRESTIPQCAFATNSTQQMITHEEIIKDLESFYHLYGSNEVLRKFRKYALEQQAKDKVHEELVRDVKRYFELDGKHSEAEIITDDEWQEYLQLITKLEKVGAKDV